MTSPFTQGSLATVFGGSGFAGRYAIRALAKNGWRVRAAVRRPDLAGHLQPMGAVGQIHAVQSNVRYPRSVEPAVIGADLVINFVSIPVASGQQTFHSVHIDGARAVARAAKKANVKKFVHISTIGADRNSPSYYGRTRALGEVAVLEEFPEAVILRPSIVFGPEDSFYNKLALLAQYLPVLPLVAAGKTKFQPVYVGDLADAVLAVTENKAQCGTIYEIGGPEVITFRQILDNVQLWTGRNRMYLPIPLWFLKLQALLTLPLPNNIRPLTLDQALMFGVNHVVSESAISEGRTLSDLGVQQLQSAIAIVPSYLERFRVNGQFSHYVG
ncbi:MAG: Aurachin B dehydrogenase [Hyphomicrobiaceae bacterium hypho_1]